MRCAVPEFLRARVAREREFNELGWSPMFVTTTDTALALIALISTLQRPPSDYLVAVPVGIAVAMCPLIVFFAAGASFNPLLIWGAWSGAAAIFLFGTSTPIPFDFAPLILVLMAGAVTAMAPVAGGLAATASGAAILGVAAAAHRLDGVWLYLSVLGMGWLVGYLIGVQQQLIVAQRAAQDALAEHAAADERRRIAREVHDVIAHSLSVTLLHLTGARRALQEDRDIDDAVDALEDAEKLGREAMADIRRTVGLLDVAPMKIAPEPGVDDIARLTDDFARAGLSVTLRTEGSAARISPAVGLALYRIAQESLANVAKHAPDSRATVTLAVSAMRAELSVVNEMPVAAPAGARRAPDGRGVRGMRQRVELLGGVIDIGLTRTGWAVRAAVPVGESGSGCRS
ncbi:histidine kinase [Mycobacterium sp. MBM]|nr:histidine kinase [Mycobacterium sp. MBM]